MRTEVPVDNVALRMLIAEARASARELLDVRGPITVSPGHLHAIARAMLGLTEACEGLHRWGLGLLVQAARHRPPGEVH
jgi:hypothetical protein